MKTSNALKCDSFEGARFRLALGFLLLGVVVLAARVRFLGLVFFRGGRFFPLQMAYCHSGESFYLTFDHPLVTARELWEADELGCVFCDIVSKTTPAYIIYEDAGYIAFLDKYPISIGHTLVLPKTHYERVNNMSQRDFCALYSRVHALNQLITSRLAATASHLSVNDGPAANQLIPHVHVHIIPRSPNDNAGFSARKLVRPEQMEEIRKKLAVDDLKLNA